MKVFAIILFAFGLFLSGITTFSSWRGKGEDKRGVVFSPFFFFAAAATLNYLCA